MWDWNVLYEISGCPALCTQYKIGRSVWGTGGLCYHSEGPQLEAGRTPWSSTQGNAKSYPGEGMTPGTRTGWNSILQKKIWRSWRTTSCPWANNVLLQSKKKKKGSLAFWAASHRVFLAGLGRWSFPSTQHCWDPSGLLCPVLLPHYKRDVEILDWVQWRATKMVQGLKYVKWGAWLRLFSLEKRRFKAILPMCIIIW